MWKTFKIKFEDVLIFHEMFIFLIPPGHSLRDLVDAV